MATFAFLQHTFSAPSVRGWVEGLEARGHRCVIVLSTRRLPHEDWSGLTVEVLPDLAWTRRVARRVARGRAKHVLTFPSPRALRRILRAHDVDVVVVKIYSVRNVLASVVALSLGARRLSWSEQVPPLNLEWRLLRAVGILPHRRFAALAARPGGVALPDDEQACGVPVLSYTPTRATRPVDRRPDSRIRFLTVAAWKNAVAKQQWRTLEAAALAGLLDGSAHFTFVGVGGPTDEGYQRVERVVRELGADAEVDLRCDVPSTEIPAVMDAHDVLVLPSVREQFGMVVPEAMVRGMAVLTTDAVGAIGLVQPERTGLVVPVDDLEALAAAMRRFVDDPGLAGRMGAEGRIFVERWASPAHAGSMLERLALG